MFAVELQLQWTMEFMQAGRESEPASECRSGVLRFSWVEVDGTIVLQTRLGSKSVTSTQHQHHHSQEQDPNDSESHYASQHRVEHCTNDSKTPANHSIIKRGRAGSGSSLASGGPGPG